MAGYDVTMVAVSSATIDTINRGWYHLDDRSWTPCDTSKSKKSRRNTARGRPYYSVYKNTFFPDSPGKRTALYWEKHLYTDSAKRTWKYASDAKGPGKISSSGSGFVKIMSADLKPTPFLDKVSRMFSAAGFM